MAEESSGSSASSRQNLPPGVCHAARPLGRRRDHRRTCCCAYGKACPASAPNRRSPPGFTRSPARLPDGAGRGAIHAVSLDDPPRVCKRRGAGGRMANRSVSDAAALLDRLPSQVPQVVRYSICRRSRTTKWRVCWPAGGDGEDIPVSRAKKLAESWPERVRKGGT